MRYIVVVGLTMYFLIGCSSAQSPLFQNRLRDMRTKIQIQEADHDLVAIQVMMSDAPEIYDVRLQTNVIADPAAQNLENDQLLWTFSMQSERLDPPVHNPEATLFKDIHTPLDLENIKVDPVKLLEIALEHVAMGEGFQHASMLLSSVTPMPEGVAVAPEDVWLVSVYDTQRHRKELLIDAQTGDVVWIEP